MKRTPHYYALPVPNPLFNNFFFKELLILVLFKALLILWLHGGNLPAVFCFFPSQYEKEQYFC
jgi:hypothetical protein